MTATANGRELSLPVTIDLPGIESVRTVESEARQSGPMSARIHIDATGRRATIRIPIPKGR